MAEPNRHDITPPEPIGKDTAPAPAAHGTYERSVNLGDPGGASQGVPQPPRPFIDPDPGSKMLNSAWDQRTNRK